MSEAFVYDAIRTPRGKGKKDGSLHEVKPVDLLAGVLAQLHAALPFTLTQAQQRVVQEIANDVARAVPMHRLLQGDVGSGKTVVAALASNVGFVARARDELRGGGRHTGGRWNLDGEATRRGGRPADRDHACPVGGREPDEHNHRLQCRTAGTV